MCGPVLLTGSFSTVTDQGTDQQPRTRVVCQACPDFRFNEPRPTAHPNLGEKSGGLLADLGHRRDAYSTACRALATRRAGTITTTELHRPIEFRSAYPAATIVGVRVGSL
jgi:hypothetical protein